MEVLSFSNKVKKRFDLKAELFLLINIDVNSTKIIQKFE